MKTRRGYLAAHDRSHAQVGAILYALPLVACLGLLASSCAQVEDMAGTGRVNSLVRSGGHMIIKLAPQVRLPEVVDLSVFGSARPGMTVSELEAALGVNRQPGHYLGGDAFYFEGDRDSVVLATRHVQSGGDEYWKEELYALPANRVTSDAIAKDVFRQIPSAEKLREVTVAENDGQQLVRLRIKSDRVESIYWWRGASSPPATSARR